MSRCPSKTSQAAPCPRPRLLRGLASLPVVSGECPGLRDATCALESLEGSQVFLLRHLQPPLPPQSLWPHGEGTPISPLARGVGHAPAEAGPLQPCRGR